MRLFTAIALFLRGLAFVAVMWASPTWAQASASAWEPTGEYGQGRELIRTWAKAVEGSPIKAFRGLSEVHYTVPEVLAMLSDVPNLKRWIFNAKSSERLPGFPPDQIYLQFNGIWPASDRDVLIRREVSQLPSGVVLLETRDVDGHPPQGGYVRMQMLNNTFRLTPLPGRWTRIEFETQVDVGGMIPAWIANIVSTKAPRVTLEGIHRQIQQPVYRGRTLADLSTEANKPGTHLRLPEAHLKD